MRSWDDMVRQGSSHCKGEKLLYLDQVVQGVSVQRETLVPVDKLGDGATNIHRGSRCGLRGDLAVP
jgi:hypothetical protein